MRQNKSKNNPPRITVYEGESYVISPDESKPNDHFQDYMFPHIGEKVKIRKILGFDEFGYRVIRVHGELSHIYWREYDFIYYENLQKPITLWDLEENLFTI